MGVNSLNVADVRLLAVRLNVGMPKWVEDEAIMHFIHNLREHPDYEVTFWNLKFHDARAFTDAAQKLVTTQ